MSGTATLTFLASMQCSFMLGIVRNIKTLIQRYIGQVEVPLVFRNEIVATNTVTLQELDLIKYLYSVAYGVAYPAGIPTALEQDQINAIYDVLKIPISQ